MFREGGNSGVKLLYYGFVPIVCVRCLPDESRVTKPWCQKKSLLRGTGVRPVRRGLSTGGMERRDPTLTDRSFSTTL